MRFKLAQFLKKPIIIVSLFFTNTVMGTTYYALNETDITNMKTLYIEDITLNTVKNITVVNPVSINQKNDQIIVKIYKDENSSWSNSEDGEIILSQKVQHDFELMIKNLQAHRTGGYQDANVYEDQNMDSSLDDTDVLDGCQSILLKHIKNKIDTKHPGLYKQIDIFEKKTSVIDINVYLNDAMNDADPNNMESDLAVDLDDLINEKTETLGLLSRYIWHKHGYKFKKDTHHNLVKIKQREIGKFGHSVLEFMMCNLQTFKNRLTNLAIEQDWVVFDDESGKLLKKTRSRGL